MYYRCHTYFSPRYGTLSPGELADRAAASGAEVLVLSDTACSGLYRFIGACEERGLKPLGGLDFRRGTAHCFTGIARSGRGYENLCEYATNLSLSAKQCPIRAPELSEVIFVYNRPLHQSLRPDEFVSLPVVGRGRDKHYKNIPPDRLIALPFFTFGDEKGYQLHRLLRCIDLNIVGGKLSVADQAAGEDRILSPDVWRQFSAQFPGVMQNTARLLDSCTMELQTGKKVNRQTFTGSHGDDRQLLFKLCREGLKLRYGPDNHRAQERLEKELAVIDKLGYSAYFLITWDIVRYGKASGFFHVGRGSGANSIAAYCLYITDVDPLELDLYFERFINPHRSSPPDFDIDFSWDERDQVTDYVFKRYGHKHTALLATYNTFGYRSVVRELGKVFGLPPADIDLIAEQPQATDRHHDYGRYILKYARMMDGMPNYLSIHAGGILITERPVFCHTALKMMPKGFPIVHFDMHDAEDMGFHKYDVLSQRGLGHIKDAVHIIRQNHQTEVDIRNVEKIKRDRAVKDQLRSGNCLGCFYIESPAMRGLLKKLRCDNYVHLVAASSIIRPGVAKSGMMREYIKRFHRPESVEYLHPTFEEQLSETFGIMVYQEDVMKIVHHFAGLDLDESDVLRRIMTGKKKSGDTFERLRAKYFRNCKKRGYSESLTSEVWRMIESFSGYSFCKAHSASFAVESFQSLYLKAYYPLEFAVAVINNFGGFYSTEFYVHEARMNGARIEAPCVNHSHYLTSIRDRVIHLGFIHLKNLERDLARQIVRERRQNGLFSSLENFMLRLNPPKEQVQILIRIGAFRFTSTGKYELMWERCGWNHRLLRDPGQQILFPVYEFDQSQLPCLTESRLEQAYDELELLGFPLCSPFELIENPPSNCIGAEQMGDKTGKNVRMCGYLVTYKPVRTVNKKRMAFVTWIDRNGHFFDSVHFPPVWEKYPLRGKGCYLLKGKVTDDFGLSSLELSHLEKLPYFPDPRYR